MSDRPWFKAFAADILTDEKLDSLPPEALGLILKMWCVCHIEGKCPTDPKELARKTRLSLDYVLQYKSQCESLFESHDGVYVSARMEREKKRSVINSDNAKERYKQKSSAICSANGNANRIKTSDYDSDYGFEVDLDLKVLEVAKLYPRIADPMNLAPIYANVIAEAIVRHGDQVLAGTKRFRECYNRWPKEQMGFASGVEKFFSTSEYLLEPIDRSNGSKPASIREMDDFKRRHAIT